MTKQCDVSVDVERFILKSQGIQYIRRDDFIEDISRLERLSETINSFKE